MSKGTTRIAGKAGPFIDLQHYLATDLAELKAPLLVPNLNWTYGTGANQVNIIYADQITLTDGGNTTLDLYASGSLLDIFQRALTLSALKFLFIKNNSPDSVLQIGGGASNDLDIFADTTDKLLLKSGGEFLWIDPSAAGVVTTTNKNLKLEDDGSGEAGDKLIDVIAMGLD